MKTKTLSIPLLLVCAALFLLRFTPFQGNLPPAELQLVGHGDGTYSVVGTNLGLPG